MYVHERRGRSGHTYFSFTFIDDDGKRKRDESWSISIIPTLFLMKTRRSTGS